MDTTDDIIVKDSMVDNEKESNNISKNIPPNPQQQKVPLQELSQQHETISSHNVEDKQKFLTSLQVIPPTLKEVPQIVISPIPKKSKLEDEKLPKFPVDYSELMKEVNKIQSKHLYYKPFIYNDSTVGYDIYLKTCSKKNPLHFIELQDIAILLPDQELSGDIINMEAMILNRTYEHILAFNVDCSLIFLQNHQLDDFVNNFYSNIDFSLIKLVFAPIIIDDNHFQLLIFERTNNKNNIYYIDTYEGKYNDGIMENFSKIINKYYLKDNIRFIE
ncbi:hypothetical protein ABK040_015764 [Willaertia magna]